MKKIFCLIIMSLLLLLWVSQALYAYSTCSETALTADGYSLAIKRYMNEGGQPVILMHGFFQNYAVWDLPEQGHSLGRFLAEKGYDVWMANFRGHGYGDYESQTPPGYEWCFDDYAVYDVDAIIKKVTDTTGKKPFWAGHSMGGFAAYGYLQGAVYKYVKVDEIWVWQGLFKGWKLEDVYGWRVESDPQLSEQRNQSLKGLISVCSPARLRWEVNITILNWVFYLFDFDKYWMYNIEAEYYANNYIFNLILSMMDYIPSEELIWFLTMDIRNIPLLGPLIAEFLEWVAGEIGTSVLFAQFWWKDNMTEELVIDELEMAVDGVSGKEMRQFISSIRDHSLLEYNCQDQKRKPYKYNLNMNLIRTPILVISGEYDKVANDDRIKQDVFDSVSSSDRSYVNFQSTGHGDMIVGLKAEAEFYPLIDEWISARSEVQ